MRILLVEDNSIDREMMTRMLSGMGHQVVQSRHGLDALNRLERDTVDAVVMDLFMPVLNGLETMEQIRKQRDHRSIPIVVVSSADPELAEECLQAGADAFLSKPCSQLELASQLAKKSDGPADLARQDHPGDEQTSQNGSENHPLRG